MEIKTSRYSVNILTLASVAVEFIAKADLDDMAIIKQAIAAAKTENKIYLSESPKKYSWSEHDGYKTVRQAEKGKVRRK